MFYKFLREVNQKYQVVSEKDFTSALLAWEFDPDLYHRAFAPTLALLRDNDIPYDLLQHRAENSPFRMDEQGFNLSPQAKGNDWSHVTVGTFQHLKATEWPSVYSMAKTMTPTYTVLRAKILGAAVSSGLSYLVLQLDMPTQARQLREFLFSRYDDFSTADSKHNFPVIPHVSLLGFAKKDETKVSALITKIQDEVVGKKMKPTHLQLWENFGVVRHIRV